MHSVFMDERKKMTGCQQYYCMFEWCRTRMRTVRLERRVGGFTSGTCFKPLSVCDGDAQADRRGQAGVSCTMIIF